MLLFSRHQSCYFEFGQQGVEIRDKCGDIGSDTICLESSRGEQAKDLSTFCNLQRAANDSLFTALFGVVFDVTHIWSPHAFIFRT